VDGFYFWYEDGLTSGAFHLTGLGVLYELVLWWKSGMGDDDNFTGSKMIESMLEAGPFLLLQMYVVIIEGDYNELSIISLAATCSSLGYAVAFTNRETNLQGEIESTSSFIVLIALCAIDACLRTLSSGLLLKVVESIFLKSCIVGCYVTAYFLFGLFCIDDGGCINGFLAMMTYPVGNFRYYELETTCRGLVNATIFMYVYTRALINVEVVCVIVTLSMFYIIISIWRIHVREDKEMVRARVLYLLTCSCCNFLPLYICNSMKRVKDTTSKDDEGSDVELKNSLNNKQVKDTTSKDDEGSDVEMRKFIE